MSKFGEYLFEFVRGVLEENPNYELQQLNVSAFEAGFDYSVGCEPGKTIQDLGTKLMRDLESVDVPASDVPITIIFLLRSKISGGMLSRRYYESLVPAEDSDELEEVKCCDKVCCNKCRNKKKNMEEDADCEDAVFRRMIREMARFLQEHVEKKGYKAHGFVAQFPFDEDFPIL